MASLAYSVLAIVCCGIVFTPALAHDKLDVVETTADCSCLTQKPVDCSSSNIAKVAAAYARLATNNCNTWANTTTANITTCNKNEKCLVDFSLVTEHHDGCPAGTLPADVDKGLHDYQTWCGGCFTARPKVAGYPTCEALDCHHTEDFRMAGSYLAANCSSDCSSNDCVTAFQALNLFHDVCFVRETTKDIAKSFTDYIKKCPSKGCNSYNSTYWSTTYKDDCAAKKNENATAIGKRNVESAAGQLSSSSVLVGCIAVWAFLLALV